jgi:hypothetical protein
MKKFTTILGAILFASVIFTSCGGGEKKETSEVTIKPKSTSVKGDLGDYFEVVDKDYVLKVEEGSLMGGAIISVEVKRTDKDFDFPTENINPFGTNGGEDYHVGFGIELLGESGPITVKQATEGGMGGPYSSEDVTGLMKLKKGETGYIRWSIDKIDELKSFQLSSALQKEDNSSSSDYSDASGDSGDSGDCEQFCSDYEAFADEYVALMKKYKANPSDASILSEYSEMISKSADMQESSKDCAADTKVAARISKAIARIAKAAM